MKKTLQLNIKEELDEIKIPDHWRYNAIGENFTVLSKTTGNAHKVCHWADGLSMTIKKNGIELELNSEEIQAIVKTLPL